MLHHCDIAGGEHMGYDLVKSAVDSPVKEVSSCPAK